MGHIFGLRAGVSCLKNPRGQAPFFAERVIYALPVPRLPSKYPTNNLESSQKCGLRFSKLSLRWNCENWLFSSNFKIVECWSPRPAAWMMIFKRVTKNLLFSSGDIGRSKSETMACLNFIGISLHLPTSSHDATERRRPLKKSSISFYDPNLIDPMSSQEEK